MRIPRIVYLTLALACAVIGAQAAPKTAHNTGATFRDCRECPLMVKLPPGHFVMGVPPGEEERERLLKERRGWAVPQHEVAIAYAFALGQYNVTAGEFAVFVRETNYRTSNRCLALSKTLDEIVGLDWRHPGYGQTPRDPVACVTWDDAKAYTAWLAKKTGRAYRLASEAEWEYAARAGTTTTRYWGDSIADACMYANVADRTAFAAAAAEHDPIYDFDCSDGYAHTAPSGTYKPNAFGLYDMLGNMWQWVEDCWTENYNGAPTDGSAVLGGDCSNHAERGGSWNSHPRSLRSAYRIYDPRDNRSNDGGFRVALTLP